MRATLWRMAVVLVLLAGAAGAAQWRFEGTAGEAATGRWPGAADAPAGTVEVEGAGKVTYAEDVPGAFIYDPIAGESAANRASLAFVASADGGHGRVAIPVTMPPRSFTLEAFVRPAAIPPKQDVALVVKRRAGDGAAEAGLRTEFLRRWNQHYLGAFVAPPGGTREQFNAGYYLGTGRIKGGAGPWRHVALVYDAEAKRYTFWLDYFQTAVRAAETPPTWDEAPLVVGGEPGQGGFWGAVDEVRLTPKALMPTEFLRARADAIRGVSFESTETVIPRGTGYVDLKEAFGAVGDGRTDDTAAFRAAFDQLANKVPLRSWTLYIPPGEYQISDTVQWTRFLAVQGAGSDRVTIRLKDKAPGFGDPKKPKAVLAMGWSPWGEWGKGAGNVIGNYLWGVTIDSGSGNPGAVGLDHHANNHGVVEDVVIRSGDGAGTIGLSFVRPWPGPALIRNVRIHGFDYGVKITRQEYSMTLEHVTLESQRVAGLHCTSNILALRRITSRNRVPAVVGENATSMITILDSDLIGGDEDEAAVFASGGLYARDVRTEGYGAALVKRVGEIENRKVRAWKEIVVDGPVIEEFVGDQVVCPRGKATGSLKLPVEEAPEVPRGDIRRDWVSVRDFEANKEGDDWAPVIRAALDAGKPTVYFPPGKYTLASTVHLKGKVRRLFGMMEGLGRAKGFEGPAMVFDAPAGSDPVLIERLSVDGFRHASPATLIVRHGNLAPYTNAPGCGKLFIENSVGGGWTFDHPQQVWARQWNVEDKGDVPSITSRGATLWILGFKTEQPSVKIAACAGARTEVLGAFLYPNSKVPKGRPIFINKNSRFAAVWGLSVYRANHSVQVLDCGPDGTFEIGNDRLLWPGSRGRMDLYVSHP